VASERVQGELAKLLEVPDCSAALAWAWRNRVLEPAFGLSIPGQKWRRIAPRVAAVDAVSMRTLPPARRRRLRLAILAGALGFSPAEAAAWLRRLRWSTGEAGDVARLLELAAWAASGLSGDEAWLWILRAADRAPDALRLLEIQSARLRRAAERLRARRRRGKKGPDLRGRDVLEWTGVAPGPEVGRLLEAVRVEGLAGRIRTRKEARLWLQTRAPTDRPASDRGRFRRRDAAL
jgi:tRNA nucleotidyltransferase/poly(A) polymerase